jgi:FHS family L-fucose permease-like MFS transporter
MAQVHPTTLSNAGADAGVDAGNQTRSLVIVTMLFFMWGLLTSLNDVLIPHLKAIYTLNYVQAAMVQFCFFGAYFIVSLPAGRLIKAIGYQRGAVTGLLIAATGCALFYPAANSGYGLFLFAFFVLAAGITILQVAANPYVTLLGPPATSSSRLTMTQAFNSLGTTVGPYVGSVLILSGGGVAAATIAAAADPVAQRAAEAASVQVPYLILAGLLLALGVVFALARLPHVENAPGMAAPADGSVRGVMSHRNLVLGVIAIFVYVGGEVSIGSFLVNYMGEGHIAGLPAETAGKYVSYYWGGAMVGRFIGAVAMRYVSPGLALAFNSSVAIALLLVAILGHGTFAMYALLGVGLFNSIMFPTIFSMALHRLGPLTGQGSGLLCMAIVGGAIVPLIQGAFADRIGLQPSFFVPIVCYAYILWFGAKYARLFQGDAQAA